MAKYIYGRYALTGGGAGALDAIDGAGLADQDMAVVMVQGGGIYHYILNATSGAAESSPNIIAPDANAGTKRWILHNDGGITNANTILATNTNKTPVAVTVAEQRIVGRITGGNIAGLTVAEVKTMLAFLEDAAPATASLRTLGTGATAACAGNDSRLSDNRLPADKSITQAKMIDFAAGNHLVASHDAVYSSGLSGVWLKAKEIRIPKAGVLRIKFTMYSGGYLLYGQIYRNGTAVGTQRTTYSTTGQEFSEDISGWSSGDLVQIFVYNTSYMQTAYVCNFQIFSSELLSFTVTF